VLAAEEETGAATTVALPAVAAVGPMAVVRVVVKMAAPTVAAPKETVVAGAMDLATALVALGVEMRGTVAGVMALAALAEVAEGLTGVVTVEEQVAEEMALAGMAKAAEEGRGAVTVVLRVVMVAVLRAVAPMAQSALRVTVQVQQATAGTMVALAEKEVAMEVLVVLVAVRAAGVAVATAAVADSQAVARAAARLVVARAEAGGATAEGNPGEAVAAGSAQGWEVEGWVAALVVAVTALVVMGLAVEATRAAKERAVA
jgi:hypothetical protein